MHHVTSAQRRHCAPARTALLLLALLFLASGAASAAAPSMTIDRPGLYTLDRDLAGETCGVLINGSDIVLDGMGHRITGPGTNGSVGVLVSGRTAIAEGDIATNVTVRNLTVSGWDDGIRIGETTETVVERVVAEQNAVGLVIAASTGITDTHVVRDSVFRANAGSVLRGKGMLLMYPAQGITVERCTISGNSGGIYADEVHSGSVPNMLVDSVISDNAGDGLYSHDGSFSVVRNCTVSANGDDGIEFEHGGAEIVGNRIEENAAAGVDVSERGGSDIHGNWITGNGFGILDGGDWPSHVRNNYLNNTDNGFFRSNGDVGALNYTTSAGPNIIAGPYLGGNVWAHPNGTGFSQTHPDTDGDGFCDEPYPVTEDAVDYLPLALQTGTPTPTPTPAPPFGGWPFKPLTVPGRIQAEDYNLGGPGPAYGDTTSGNSGGAYRQDDVDIEVQGSVTNVGWIRNGEYLTYSANVTTAGEYTMTARVASPNSGRTIAVTTYGNGVSGAPVGTIAVPNTGSFATFREVGVPVTLVAGTHEFRLTFSGDGQNLDWISFAPAPGPTPTPTPTANVPLPGTIQAEDYDLGGEGVAYHDTTAGNSGGAYRSDSVDVAALPGGGHAIVGIEDGEYLTYTIGGVTPTPELPALVLYLGSDRDGGRVELEVNGRAAGNVSVPNTGSPIAFRAVQTQVQAAKGTLRLRFHGSGMGLDRIESPLFVSYADRYGEPDFTADRANGTAPLTVRFTDTSPDWTVGWHWTFGDGGSSTERNPTHVFQRPGVYAVTLTVDSQDHWEGGSFVHYFYSWVASMTVEATGNGTGPAAHAVPGRIEAEDYNLGGEGVAYHDTTPGNSGGAYRHDGVDIEAGNGITNVGWIRNGEWLAYTANVSTAGTYTMTARVASPNSGRTIAVLVDGAAAATIAVPNTGSFAAFRAVSVPVTLQAGTHTLKLAFSGDGQNLDWVAFAQAPVTPPTTPVPSGGASFSAVPTTAPHGSAVKFTVTPASGKAIASAWWSFDAPAHLSTWNSRATSPTFFYPRAGTFSPLVKLTYTDGSTETVQRTGYVTGT